MYKWLVHEKKKGQGFPSQKHHLQMSLKYLNSIFSIQILTGFLRESHGAAFWCPCSQADVDILPELVLRHTRDHPPPDAGRAPRPLRLATEATPITVIDGGADSTAVRFNPALIFLRLV